MALSFPFTVPQFAEVIRVSSIVPRLVGEQQMSGMGGGNILVADLAPKRWEFEVTLITMQSDVARAIQALIEALDESMNAFEMYDPSAAYPIADPDGSILGASAVKINSIDTGNNKELTLKGLPAGYVLSAGDLLHFDFGSPSNRALHRVVVGGIAGSGGVSTSLEVRPHILPGAAVNADVTLIKPAARVKMIPGSFNPGVRRQHITTGMAFKCRQEIV
jgi:hypothetical protein